MNIKNRGFSLLIAIIASLILMGVSVGIITSIVRSLDQVNNIARANQTFFATESAYENALFHHGARGGNGLAMSSYNTSGMPHDNINAEIAWNIDGRDFGEVSGEISENEKITIPLHWDVSVHDTSSPSIYNLPRDGRILLKLAFSDQNPFDNTNNSSFDFGTSSNDVLFVWSVSRIDPVDGLQTFIPIANSGSEPCGSGSYFYCKSDFSGSGTQHFTAGVIDFNSSTTDGEILPGNVPTNLRDFMYDVDSTEYEISFQPILPFTSQDGNTKIPQLYYTLDAPTGPLVPLPKNIFDIEIDVYYPDFQKKSTISVKENPSVSAFDYLIFK